MFSSVDLYANNKLVISNMDTYPYKAYFKSLYSVEYLEVIQGM